MIAMHHGIGGGRPRGGKVNNLERFETVISIANLYLQGHTHTYDFLYNSTQYIDRKRNNLQVGQGRPVQLKYRALHCIMAA